MIKKVESGEIHPVEYKHISWSILIYLTPLHPLLLLIIALEVLLAQGAGRILL